MGASNVRFELTTYRAMSRIQALALDSYSLRQNCEISTLTEVVTTL